jgi:hypothetical protein
MKNLKKILLGICTMVFLIVFAMLLTPKGGTRLAILCNGFPIEAFTTKLIYDKYIDGVEYFDLSEPPYDKETETVLKRYYILKYGIFYWARYSWG